MIALDTNVPIYAHRSETDRHKLPDSIETRSAMPAATGSRCDTQNAVAIWMSWACGGNPPL